MFIPCSYQTGVKFSQTFRSQNFATAKMGTKKVVGIHSHENGRLIFPQDQLHKLDAADVIICCYPRQVAVRYPQLKNKLAGTWDGLTRSVLKPDDLFVGQDSPDVFNQAEIAAENAAKEEWNEFYQNLFL